MSQTARWIGFLATLVIFFTLAGIILREPERQQAALAQWQARAVREGTELYIQQCMLCHGPEGLGTEDYPDLTARFVREKDARLLYTTIARGQTGTEMAAFLRDEGGPLTAAQIDNLVALIQHGEWPQVTVRVAALGLLPTPTVVPSVTATATAVPSSATPTVTAAGTVTATAELAAATPLGVAAVGGGGPPAAGDVDLARLLRGFGPYTDFCAVCHGPFGEGNELAPALDTRRVMRKSTEDLAEILIGGIQGTSMEGFGGRIRPAERTDLIYLMQNWPALPDAEAAMASGVVAPAAPEPAATAEATPLPVAASASLPGTDGEAVDLARLLRGFEAYSDECATCHGPYGEGTELAPQLDSRRVMRKPLEELTSIIVSGIQGTSMEGIGSRIPPAERADLLYLMQNWPALPDAEAAGGE